ncbi:conserved hypothetical protein [delta proteobacterium NaphS2]|nr:conserved hypothetical protein [delta proteobacterium NaphS2]
MESGIGGVKALILNGNQVLVLVEPNGNVDLPGGFADGGTPCLK